LAAHASFTHLMNLIERTFLFFSPFTKGALFLTGDYKRTPQRVDLILDLD